MEQYNRIQTQICDVRDELEQYTLKLLNYEKSQTPSCFVPSEKKKRKPPAPRPVTYDYLIAQAKERLDEYNTQLIKAKIELIRQKRKQEVQLQKKIAKQKQREKLREEYEEWKKKPEPILSSCLRDAWEVEHNKFRHLIREDEINAYYDSLPNDGCN